LTSPGGAERRLVLSGRRLILKPHPRHLVIAPIIALVLLAIATIAVGI
jgi:hypothetical protein